MESEFGNLEYCEEGIRAHQCVVNVGGGFSHTEWYIPAEDGIGIHANNRVLILLSRCLWNVREASALQHKFYALASGGILIANLASVHNALQEVEKG